MTKSQTFKHTLFNKENYANNSNSVQAGNLLKDHFILLSYQKMLKLRLKNRHFGWWDSIKSACEPQWPSETAVWSFSRLWLCSQLFSFRCGTECCLGQQWAQFNSYIMKDAATYVMSSIYIHYDTLACMVAGSWWSHWLRLSNFVLLSFKGFWVEKSEIKMAFTYRHLCCTRYRFNSS